MVRVCIYLLVAAIFICPSNVCAAEEFLTEFKSLIHRDTWSENWTDSDGQLVQREVSDEIYTLAFQAAIDKYKHLHIKARKKPYYLDGPLILRSGDSIKADPTAEIRLLPNTNTCMVRNENIVGFAKQAVPAALTPDRNISIEGGIWTTLANGDPKSNGNLRGHSSKKNYVPNTHGVILFQNIADLSVRNITVRKSKPFAIHLGNANNFLIDGLKLDHHGRDGVHVNGPSSNGVIRNVSGSSHDDTVALNAWEWRNYAPSYGPIHNVVIENISGAEVNIPSANSIRLLPGVKQFSDGKTLECSIHDIVIQNIRDIKEFKMYDQPNLEHGREHDYSLTLGRLRNIYLKNLEFSRPGVIQIAAQVEQLHVNDVKLNFNPTANFKLVEIGPMSRTWRHTDDPTHWVEIFSPDRDVTVKNFSLKQVKVNGQLVAEPQARFVQVRDQQLNPDYPNTTPRGGIGKARLLP